jgi:hypothetical protein
MRVASACGSASAKSSSARVSQRVVAAPSVFISANISAIAGSVRSVSVKSRERR